MIKRHFCAITSALLFILSGCSSSNSKFQPKGIAQHVKTLSSDEFEGRAPNSPGEIKTIDYIIREFTNAGLAPGGELENGQPTWVQKVPLQQTSFDGPIQIALNLKGKTNTLHQGQDIALRPSMHGPKEVDIKNAPIYFVGFGIQAPEKNWDDFKGLDLNNKLALVLVNDPDFETIEGDFEGNALTYYGRWTYKFEQMAKLGALGTIIIHETKAASYGWETVKNSNTQIMFDIVRKNPTQAHAPIESWIQLDIAKNMLHQANLDFDKLKLMAQTKDFKPVLLNGVTLSTKYKVKSEVIISHNVLGIKTGTSDPHSTIIYTGHWDHLGIGLPDKNGDKIYNGAVDNAAGISAIIELAKKFGKTHALSKSVVFMALTAEERGLLGSTYYTVNPIYPLKKTIGVINLDSFRPNGLTLDFSYSGNIKQELTDMLIEKAKQWNVRYTPDTSLQNGYFFRSDNFPFYKVGVPAVSFSSGKDLVEGGIAAGRDFDEKYNKNNYHQPSDEFSPSWSFTGMARDLEILYELGYDLSK